MYLKIIKFVALVTTVAILILQLSPLASFGANQVNSDFIAFDLSEECGFMSDDCIKSFDIKSINFHRTVEYYPPDLNSIDISRIECVVGILSSASNYKTRRQIVRRTWLRYPGKIIVLIALRNLHFFLKGNWKPIFLVAFDAQAEVVEQVRKEYINFGDILILNEKESYDSQGFEVSLL
jgi:hypothetical protein